MFSFPHVSVSTIFMCLTIVTLIPQLSSVSIIEHSGNRLAPLNVCNQDAGCEDEIVLLASDGFDPITILTVIIIDMKLPHICNSTTHPGIVN